MKNMITVDIRGSRPHVGKTLLARVLWFGLKQLGYDPEDKLVTVDSQDRDLTYWDLNDAEVRSTVEAGVARMNEQDIELCLVDLNLPMSMRATGVPATLYQARSKTRNEQWSNWLPTSFQRYLELLAEPEQGHVTYEVRSINKQADGPKIAVPELQLAALKIVARELESMATSLGYDDSLAGEPAGALKRAIRAQNHIVRAIMNGVYSDPMGASEHDVEARRLINETPLED